MCIRDSNTSGGTVGVCDKIGLEEQDVEQCDGTVTQEEALPVVPLGIVKVKDCERYLGDFCYETAQPDLTLTLPSTEAVVGGGSVLYPDTQGTGIDVLTSSNQDSVFFQSIGPAFVGGEDLAEITIDFSEPLRVKEIWFRGNLAGAGSTPASLTNFSPSFTGTGGSLSDDGTTAVFAVENVTGEVYFNESPVTTISFQQQFTDDGTAASTHIRDIIIAIDPVQGEAYGIQDANGDVNYYDKVTNELIDLDNDDISLVYCPNNATIDGVVQVEAGETDVRNLNDIKTKECFERPSGLVNTLKEPDTGSVLASIPAQTFFDDPAPVTSIFVRINNESNSDQPYNITVSGFNIDPFTVPLTPTIAGFTQGAATQGVYEYELVLPQPLIITDDVILTGDTVANVLWSVSPESDGGQVQSVAANQYPNLLFATGGYDNYCRKTTFGGEVIVTGQLGQEVSELPAGVSSVPCDVSCNEDCNEDLAERIADKFGSDKYVGSVKYQEMELATSGSPVPLDAATGSAGDVSWSFIGGNNVTHSTTTPGDTRWENTSLIEIVFTGGLVQFTASPTNGGDVLNPIVWQNQQGGETSVESPNGDPVVYTAGSFDALLDTTTDPQKAEATLPNSGAPDASDDWGTVVAGATDQVFIRGRDAEAMNFSIQTLSLQPTGACKTAYGCLIDGNVVYRDALTNEIVDFNVTPIVESCGDSGGGSSELVSLTKIVTRATGSNAYVAPYKSLSVTTISDDVEIDGQLVPRGFTWSVDSNRYEQFSNDTTVDGTDYIVTEVR